MKCERFKALAGLLARSEIMDADERDSALAHASICKGCADTLTAQIQLSESLRSLAEETKAVRPSTAMENNVVMAFRERRSAVTASTSSRRWRSWAVAAAAVVLLVLGLAVWRWYVASVERQNQRASSQQLPTPVSEPSRAASTPTPINETPTPRPLIAEGPQRVIPRRRPRIRSEQPQVAVRREEPSVPATPTETQEVVTHFVSLGYGSAFDLQDGAQMVRVELPRSALARFGLPMNMDRADERIKADVLVGADGLARAIRFVQPADQTISELKPGNERNEQ